MVNNTQVLFGNYALNWSTLGCGREMEHNETSDVQPDYAWYMNCV